MDMIKDIINSQGGDLIQMLTSKCGFAEGEAKGLLGGIVEKVTSLIGKGDLDLGDLLGDGGPQALLAKLNPGEIAAAAGVDEEKAKQGMNEVVPSLVSKIKEEGGSQLTEMLGGGKEGLLGTAGKLAGGFFGK